MAGPDPDGNFVAADFYASLRATMLMAMPGPAPASVKTRLLNGQAVEVADFGSPDTAVDWPTFFFEDTRTYSPADEAGEPWTWTETPIGPAPAASVRVLCAISETDATGSLTNIEATPVGNFNADRGILVLFEPEWLLVSEFKSLLIGQREYLRQKQLHPSGLFDATIRRIEIAARDL